MSIIVSIFKKELIDVLRDRRTLMFMVVIPILITPLLVIGSIKFQEYQNKKSEEKILKIAYINESEDSLTKQLLSDQKGVKIIEGVPIDSIKSYIKSFFIVFILTEIIFHFQKNYKQHQVSLMMKNQFQSQE